MRTLFVSDLHLNPDVKSSGDFFCHFLKETIKPGDQLYILGDLFESYIGDDDHCVFIQKIKLALKELHIPIFVMHGNRDFLIGKSFAKEIGATLLHEECVIDLYGVRTLLMHGDTLCTNDKKYLRFRKIVRCRFVQACFSLLPLSLRKSFAEHARKKSSAYTKSANMNIMDVTQSAVEAVMKKHGVTRLIHGHTHRPFEHDVLIGNTTGQRIVLSDWHDSAKIIICENSNPLHLTTTPPPPGARTCKI